MFKGHLAAQYQLFVNGNLVPGDRSISIREQEARNARVEVMKPGCADYQGYLNLTQPLTHTIVLQELPIRSASHTSKSNSSVFASKKFLLGMIVYTVIVFFAGICLGDLINKNDIQENPEMATPIENEVSPESENNFDSESSELQSEGKRNTDRKASRNQQTEQAEKPKDKAKSQGKETEEPKEKAGADAATSGKSVSQSADKHASQTNGNKGNESANVSIHSSEDSPKNNKEK